MRKRFFFYTISLFLFLGFFSPVFAVSQTDFSTSFSNSTTGGATQFGGQSLGTGLVENFDTLKLYLGATGSADINFYISVRICQADDLSGFYGYGSGDNGCPVSFTSTIKKYGITDINSAGWYDFDFGSHTFLSDKYYLIDIYINTPAGDKFQFHGANNDNAYINGTGYNSTWGSFGYLPNYSQFFRTYTGIIFDLAFQTSSTPAFIISMEYPSDLASLPSDFTTWVSKFTTTAGGSYSVKIDYFAYAFPSTIYSDSAGLSMPAEATDYEFPVAKSNLLIGGHNYNAIMYLLDSDNNILASDTADFTAGYGIFDNYTYVVIPPTSTSTELNISCDPDSGFFQYSLCYLATSLFIPSTDSLDNYYGLWDMIKHKAPIGYISSAIDSYSEMKTATSSAFTLATPPELNTTILDPFKTGLTWILWFSFGIFIIKRIGKENL